MTMSPSPAVGGRVLKLEDFEAAPDLGQLALREYRRHFLTLLDIDPQRTRHGGTGKVLGTFNCYGERICLKCLKVPPRVGFSAGRWQRTYEVRRMAFDDEYACQLATAGTPGMPLLYGRASYQGGPVILAEWVEGVTLDALRRSSDLVREDSHTLDRRTCTAIGSSVCQVLLEARRRCPGFVHRDVSPRNVIVRTDRRPLSQQLDIGTPDICLIDLGSAVIGARESACHPDAGMWKNATAEYAAPEMLSHDNEQLLPYRYGERVDVYALCSVLYELYTGRTPFQLSKAGEVPEAEVKLTAPVPVVHTLCPADDSFCNAVSAGLSPKPEDRPTLEELAKIMTRGR